jgi:hypothetical protein
MKSWLLLFHRGLPCEIFFALISLGRSVFSQGVQKQKLKPSGKS